MRSDEPITENAIIESVSLGYGERGILEAWAVLKFDGSGQGFGGYALYLPADFKHHGESMRANVCGHFIYRVLEVAGVTEWAKLEGRTVRAKHTNSNVIAIGHIVKDDWFDPSADFEAMRTKAAA